MGQLKGQFFADINTGLNSATLPNGAVIHARSALNTADFYDLKNTIGPYFQNLVNPKIRFKLKVKTGAALDPENKPGLHHFLEHCLCRTRKYSSLDALIEAFEERGGLFNASTSATEMTFYGELDSNSQNLKFLMDYLDEILNNPSFPDDVIKRERNRILTEFLEYEDSPESRVGRMLFSNIIRVDGRSSQVLGTEESVKSITRDDLEEAHRRFFTAANAELAVSSTFSPLSVINSVQKRLKKMPVGIENKFANVTYNFDPEIILDEPESKSSNFAIYLNAGHLTQEEVMQLNVVTKLLNSYLYREMINKGVVYHCNVSDGAIGEQHGILITGKVRADSIDGITPSIIAAFEKFADGISPYRYATSKKDVLENFSSTMPIDRFFDDVKRYGPLQTVGKTHEKAVQLMKPDALLTFVRDKILVNPVGIAINGGKNTRHLTQTLKPALNDLGKRLVGVSVSYPSQKSWLNSIRRLVLRAD